MDTSNNQTLPESSLYSFIDQTQTWVLTFLEGQKLVQDIVIRQPDLQHHFGVYREAILGFQHLVHFFKENEQLGFYFESEDGSFSFKLESSPKGQSRCTLVNHHEGSVPSAWTGNARFLVAYPELAKEPVQSVIRVENATVPQIFNQVITSAMQISAEIVVSEDCDQSIMITKLPDLGGKTVKSLAGSYEELMTLHLEAFKEIWKKALTEQKAIVSELSSRGFSLLRSRPMAFKCPCSYERMLANVAMLWARSEPDLFNEDQNSLEIVCDFCSEKYQVTEKEAQAFLENLSESSKN